VASIIGVKGVVSRKIFTTVRKCNSFFQHLPISIKTELFIVPFIVHDGRNLILLITAIRQVSRNENIPPSIRMQDEFTE